MEREDHAVQAIAEENLKAKAGQADASVKAAERKLSQSEQQNKILHEQLERMTSQMPAGGLLLKLVPCHRSISLTCQSCIHDAATHLVREFADMVACVPLIHLVFGLSRAKIPTGSFQHKLLLHELESISSVKLLPMPIQVCSLSMLENFDSILTIPSACG